MEGTYDNLASEKKRLERCINDLVSLLALPAIWSGRESSEIVRTLLDALVGMLRLDFAHARLKAPGREPSVDLVHVAEARRQTLPSSEIAEWLDRWADNPREGPQSMRDPIDGAAISIVPLPLGLQGELGLIVAGSRRPGFPEQTETLVMSVAANQAAIALQTERRRAEAKSRESELELRQLTETIPEMLWRATPEGAVDYCNARVLAYTGLSSKEIMGKGWTKLLHPDEVDRTRQAWMSCVESGEPYKVEVRIFHAADRAYRWCVTSALPLRDERGRILKWHGTVVDMHDWKLAQQELRDTQAERAHMMRVMTMGQLTASIAHEVNQPLSAIVTNSETSLRWLARPTPDIAKACELATRVVADARRASDIIARIRAMTTRRAPQPILLSLDEIVEESAAFLSHEIQSKGAAVSLDLRAAGPRVLGDRIQLQQVVVNLAVNSVQAMARSDAVQRVISMRTLLEGPETVCCVVEDSGPGIDPAHIPRLFDPFFTTKDSGMGMGLQISRSIIEAHGGRIQADNGSALGGARFSFTLPAGPAN